MKIYFVSLGCDKNLADSEEMLGILNRAGYDFTDDAAEAEVIIVNSCCFIGDAMEESINTVLELARMKTEGRALALLVTGCLAERYRDEILKEMPEVDGIVGTRSWDHIAEAIDAVLAGKKAEEFHGLTRMPKASGERVITTGGYYGYLKIAEGCDRRCTYCVIPYVRGGYTSVPMEDLVCQAEHMAHKGVSELILVAQETTRYGVDLYGKKMLPELLKRLAAIPDLHWIRILYCYPEEITDELIETIAAEDKICHYLDIPVQHASDAVLKRMGRHTTGTEIRDRLKKIREKIPDIAIRTTLMTGFPGETEEDHEEMLAFVDETEFERLGVFVFSAQEGTPAYTMPDQVPEEVSNARRDEIMELQQEIAFDKAQANAGRLFEVLVEGKLTGEDVYVGRTYMDCPDVDGNVFFTSDRELLSGEYVTVRITKGAGYDLVGEEEDTGTED